ncbi:hypothetical protein D9M72_385100 [compost metagenome]
MPNLHLCVLDGVTVRIGEAAAEVHRCALLVLTHLYSGRGRERGGPRHVVRPFNGAHGSGAILGVDVLHSVLQPHVKEERPFPVGAHLDKPGFECVVFLVGDLVLDDDVIGGFDECPRQQTHSFLRHIQVGELA